MHDALDRPRTLLPTHQVSDFSRNFADLEKRAKHPYSVMRLVRGLSSKPNRLDGFEIEVSQELKSLNPARNQTGVLVPVEAFGVSRRDLTTGVLPVIQTSVSDESPIPFLRVRSVCGPAAAHCSMG